MCVVHRHWMPQRSGLALVELLVVIVILGSLVALLLPAVQAARESGRRAQCRSNVRQIGTALQQHVSSHGTFRPGSPALHRAADLRRPRLVQYGILVAAVTARVPNVFNFTLDAEPPPPSP